MKVNTLFIALLHSPNLKIYYRIESTANPAVRGVYSSTRRSTIELKGFWRLTLATLSGPKKIYYRIESNPTNPEYEYVIETKIYYRIERNTWAYGVFKPNGREDLL